jgi:hypothetical protein
MKKVTGACAASIHPSIHPSIPQGAVVGYGQCQACFSLWWVGKNQCWTVITKPLALLWGLVFSLSLIMGIEGYHQIVR